MNIPFQGTNSEKIVEPLRLAYLTTKYPAVSHTFIRRELREVEARGHLVLRMSIRPPNTNLADPLDLEETKKTFHCLSRPFSHHLLAVLKTVLFRPRRFINALLVTIRAGLISRHLIKNLAYFIEACSLLDIILKHRIQHIHVHFGTNPAAVARLIRRLGGPGYSFTVHGPAEFDNPAGIDLAGKIAESTFVVAITDYCSAQLRRWSNPSDWHKIQVVHCTVGDDFFNAQQPLTPDCRTFVCVGRLSAQKGQLVLIDAFAGLIAAGHDARLVFVGDGELRPMIEQRIRESGQQERITITGYVSEAEVRRHIRAGRALVLPSFAEGLPMVIMEAFAVGRPVISTYIAGIPELVRDRENGWLIPAGNTEALTVAMAEALAKSEDQLAVMAQAGREMTHTNHRTTTEVDTLEKLFHTALFESPTQG
jgi:glycosyltransferase involved in cell wall biosynthesis